MPERTGVNRATRNLLIVSIAVPLALYAGLSWHLRGERLREGTASVEQTVKVLEENALRVFEAQQLIMDRVDQYIKFMSWEDIRTSERVHLFLKEVSESSPHVDGLWLVSPDGQVANSAGYFPVTDVNAQERDYFRALAARDDLHFGEMIFGKVKANLNFNLSRRRSPRDNFNGLILVTSSIDYFTTFWQEVSPYSEPVAGLFRSDGKILARYPALQELPAQLEPGSQLLRDMNRGGSQVDESDSSIDGERRIFGFSRVEPYPIFVGFGVSVDEVLAPWRRDLLWNGLIALIVAMLLAGVSTVALRQNRQLALAVGSWRETAGKLRNEVDRRARAEDVAAERERLLIELGKATAERKAILDSMVEGVTAYGPDGSVIYWNHACRFILSLPDLNPPNFESLAREGRVMHLDGTPLRPGQTPVARLLRGETLAQEEYRLDLTGADRPVVCRFSGAPLLDRRGRPSGAVLTFADVTEEKSSEERRMLLLSELDHRVRNMLATIMAMVRLSSDQASDKQTLVETLTGRISAMTRTHGLLTRNSWRGASLGQIVRDEVQPYRSEGRLVLQGKDDVVLPPKDAVDFALVVHELATNAAKYGAWSGPAGRVEVSWALEHEKAVHVHVVWRECDGPPVTQPKRTGFGSALIRSAFREEDAGVELRHEPSGVVCEIRIPLRGSADQATLSPAEEMSAPAVPSPGALSGLRVLVVEDEPFVQLDLAGILKGAGASVAGPAANVAEARRMMIAGGFDMALLDVNLGGENVSPIAEALIARGIPVVFATGYRDLELLSPRLRHLPRLQKPFSSREVVMSLTAVVPRLGFAG